MKAFHRKLHLRAESSALIRSSRGNVLCALLAVKNSVVKSPDVKVARVAHDCVPGEAHFDVIELSLSEDGAILNDAGRNMVHSVRIRGQRRIPTMQGTAADRTGKGIASDVDLKDRTSYSDLWSIDRRTAAKPSESSGLKMAHLKKA